MARICNAADRPKRGCDAREGLVQRCLKSSSFLVCLATLGTLAAAPAHGESLRCNGRSAGEGESRLAVLYKCGEPLLKDSYCAPWVQSGTLQPLPGAYAAAVAPCQPVEEWVYDRGPGNLMATVRFKSGVVQSIIYGRAPQTP